MAWTTLANGTIADASEVDNNFYHVRQGSLVPLGSASMVGTSGVYDIGSATYKWKSLYVTEIPQTVTVSGEIFFATATAFRVELAQAILQEITPVAVTSGTLITGGAWFKRAVNTITFSNIPQVTISASGITLPPGTWVGEVEYLAQILTAATLLIDTRLYNTTAGQTIEYGIQQGFIGAGGAFESFVPRLSFRFSITVSSVLEVQYYDVFSRQQPPYYLATGASTASYFKAVFTKIK